MCVFRTMMLWLNWYRPLRCCPPVTWPTSPWFSSTMLLRSIGDHKSALCGIFSYSNAWQTDIYIPYSLLIAGTNAFLFACVNTDETAQEIESKRCVWCCRFFSHVSTLHLTCSACVAASIRTSSSTLTARTPRTGTTPSSGEWVKWASWSLHV